MLCVTTRGKEVYTKGCLASTRTNFSRVVRKRQWPKRPNGKVSYPIAMRLSGYAPFIRPRRITISSETVTLMTR